MRCRQSRTRASMSLLWTHYYSQSRVTSSGGGGGGSGGGGGATSTLEAPESSLCAFPPSLLPKSGSLGSSSDLSPSESEQALAGSGARRGGWLCRCGAGASVGGSIVAAISGRVFRSSRCHSCAEDGSSLACPAYNSRAVLAKSRENQGTIASAAGGAMLGLSNDEDELIHFSHRDGIQRGATPEVTVRCLQPCACRLYAR